MERYFRLTPDGTLAALEHEGDYGDHDRLFRMNEDGTVGQEVPNESLRPKTTTTYILVVVTSHQQDAANHDVISEQLYRGAETFGLDARYEVQAVEPFELPCPHHVPCAWPCQGKAYR